MKKILMAQKVIKIFWKNAKLFDLFSNLTIVQKSTERGMKFCWLVFSQLYMRKKIMLSLKHEISLNFLGSK